MLTTTLVKNFKVSAPFITSAIQVADANAGANIDTLITAPLNTAATLAVQSEISDDGQSGWAELSSLKGARGGTGKDGVSPNVYEWAMGITPDMVGKFLRVNFTVVSGGTWTLNVTETV